MPPDAATRAAYTSRGTSGTPMPSIQRLKKLKIAQTVTASYRAASDQPAALAASASARVIEAGASLTLTR
jgi:hypothetical protein